MVGEVVFLFVDFYDVVNGMLDEFIMCKDCFRGLKEFFFKNYRKFIVILFGNEGGFSFFGWLSL